MRALVDPGKLEKLMEALGRACRGPGRIYFTGGASALLVGWRESTVDVDLKLDPEPAGAFEAIARLKDELDVNVELAAPDQFVPVPSDWRDRSPFIARHGRVDFHHFDFRAQALSKLARGNARDLGDVEAMESARLITRESLRDAFDEIRPGLARYPGIDAEVFERRFRSFLAS